MRYTWRRTRVELAEFTEEEEGDEVEFGRSILMGEESAMVQSVKMLRYISP